MTVRELFDDIHDSFREAFRSFVATEIVPFNDAWEQAGRVDRGMFAQAGARGFLGMAVPEQYGGLGQPDFRFNVVISEELQRANVLASGTCITLHNDIVLPYFLTATSDEQRRRWLPGMVTGERMGAISMSEPGAGSDIAAIRTSARLDGDHYVVNGSKTFVTNGLNADTVVLAVKTDTSQRHKGISLLVVEEPTPGFERGRKLDKIGQRSQDTAELFFNDARVPVSNRLGDEGTGFALLMGNLVQERLSMAVNAIAGAREVLGWTLDYCRQRTAFGGPLTDQQFVRFEFAEMTTATEIGQVYVDHLVSRLDRGDVTAEDAAKAKYWMTELQQDVVNRCLQLHGGYGYMREYPVARAFLDARIQTIYGGTTQIMKEIIGRAVVGARR
ncbi:MAG: acyl-CoA dehydrogenase family protein [Streptosporangiaceae bacterium]